MGRQIICLGMLGPASGQAAGADEKSEGIRRGDQARAGTYFFLSKVENPGKETCPNPVRQWSLGAKGSDETAALLVFFWLFVAKGTAVAGMICAWPDRPRTLLSIFQISCRMSNAIPTCPSRDLPKQKQERAS